MGAWETFGLNSGVGTCAFKGMHGTCVFMGALPIMCFLETSLNTFLAGQSCINNCNSRGTCIAGFCHCQPGVRP